MMKKRFFSTSLVVLLMLLLIPSFVLGQESIDPNYLKEHLPASPEAANLGSYGEIATNPYNGKVNLSIPIHQIDLDGLSIPIQLSYDSGGIRVSAESSWVGMNWSLSANAAITRSIFGNDDLNENEIINSDISAFPFNNQTYVAVSSSGIPSVSLDDVITMQQSYDSDIPPHGKGDMQPDIYQVSLFGKNYKFRFNKRNGTRNILTTHIFDNHHATILYNLQTQTFTIEDDRGFVYVFATKDYAASMSSTRSSNANQGSSSIKEDTIDGLLDDLNQREDTAITSWLLDSITAPTGEQLTFSYVEGAHFTYPQYSGSVRFRDRHIFPANDAFGENYNQNNAKYTTSMSIVHSNYLSEISGDFGRVIFNAVEDRPDLMTGNDLLTNFPGTFTVGGFVVTTFTNTANNLDSRHGTSSNPAGWYQHLAKRLTSIDIKDYNDQDVRHISFDQSYYDNNRLGDADQAKYLRLKLDGATIEDKTYSFTYETPNMLPAKNSFKTDFWGFYNGANNTSNVPSIGRFCTSPLGGTVDPLGPKQVYFNLNGADRGADFSFGNRGNLIKITYPTGGSSAFEYEGNRAVVDGATPYFVTEYLDNGTTPRWNNLIDEDQYKFTYQYLKHAESPSYNFFDYQHEAGNTTNTTPVSLNIPFPVDNIGLFQAEGDMGVATWSDTAAAFLDVAKVYVENINSGTIYVLLYYGDWQDIPVGANNEQHIVKSVVLPPGDYRIKDIVTPEGAPNVYFINKILTISQTVADTSDPNLPQFVEEFPIGGLRIKTITNIDNNGAFINKKQFDYNFQGNDLGNLSSSGKLMDDIIHHSRGVGFRSYTPTFWIEGRPGQNDDSGYGVSITSNMTLKQSPNAQGTHIGYSFVREYALDKDDAILSIMDRSYFNEPNSYEKDNYNHIFYWNHTYPASAIEYTEARNVLVLGMDPRLSFEYLNGNVLSEKYFDCGETLVREVNTEYKTLIVNPDDNFYASFAGWGYVPPQAGESENPFMTDDVSYITYKQPFSYSRKAVPSYTQTIDYLSNGQVYTDQYFTYDNVNQNLIETESIVRDGESTVTKYYYPYDQEVTGIAGVSNLLGENQLSQVVKSETFYKDQRLGTTLLNFADNTSTGNNVRVTKTQTAKGSDALEDRKHYDLYDTDGNVLQSHYDDGATMSYIWGYNNEYVIAKVENITYADLALLTSISNLQNLSNADTSRCLGDGTCNEQILRNALNNLRDALPSDAFMTSYTYDPLIGVTSITDSRGGSVYYSYDSFDRLEAVYDQNYKLFSKNEYNITHDLINTLGEDALGITECGSTVSDETDTTTGDGDTGDGDGDISDIIIIGSRMADNTMLKDGISYPALSNSIDLVGSQPSGSQLTLSYQAFPYGGSGNLMYRWKLKGGTFSSYSSSPNWTVAYDCSLSGIEVICEVKDMELELTERTRLTHQVLCNN